ncbi:hypothetical protein NBRC10513_004592 [Rhodotorula toruloides]
MPLTSDRWTADRFPVPRIDEAPSPTASPLASLITSPALVPLHFSSSHSSPTGPPQSPTAPPSPFSPIARTDNRPFHLSAAPHPRWFTSHLHQLERDISHSRSRLAEVEAEETYHFPDASEATHSKPLIPNQIKGFVMPGADTAEVKVCGDLAALGAGAGVAVWSASCDLASSIVRGTILGDMANTMCWSQSGRYLWVGTWSGHLREFDTAAFAAHPTVLTTFPLEAHRADAHPSGQPIVLISRIFGDQMLTLDSTGRIVVWLPDEKHGKLASLHSHSKVFQIPPDPMRVNVVGDLVWADWKVSASEAPGGLERRVVRVYDVSGTRAVLRCEKGWDVQALGGIFTFCSVPSHPQFVFAGHATGHISIWKSDGTGMLGVKRVSKEAITALCGPSRFLWVGYASGVIDVIDLGSSDRWKVVKRWRAHRGPVLSLGVDASSLWTASSLRVYSGGADFKVRFWDGLLRDDWISRRMQDTVETYCDFSPLRMAVFTWNCDGQDPALLQRTEASRSLFASFLQRLDRPDLVVFNFQELVDLSDLTLAARTVLFATATHDVTGRYRHWRTLLADAVERFLGPDYTLVHEDKLVGLFTVVFARRAVASQMKDLASCHIKSGFDETYGNKGSILLRFVLQDSSFCLINAHLAAGKTHPAERQRDLIQILDAASRFPRPGQATHNAYIGGGDGTEVLDCETVFFAGDLNFRIQLPREEVLRILAKSDPYSRLLPHDELTALKHDDPAFRLRAFVEAPIDFPPTYKYDHFSSQYDTSAKQRTPSWCDRILWRTQRKESVKCLRYERFEADMSDHRPVAATFQVMVRTIDPVRADSAYRRTVHDWAEVEEELLQTARRHHPVGQ